MRKILVPTDFSENATSALEYALQLALPFGAEIVLAHIVVNQDFPAPRQTGQPLPEAVQQELMGQLNRQATTALQGASAETPVTLRIASGRFVEAANELVQREQCDLVVMGTKGASGLRRAFVGSNTTDLTEYTHVPIIVVPGTYKFKGLQRILLSLDLRRVEQTAPYLPEVAVLARKFQSEFIVLSVGVNDGAVNRQSEMLRQAIGDRPVNYLCLPDEDPVKAIGKYTTDLQPDLLVLHPQRKTVWQLFFGKSVTREILFHPQLPVMVMPLPDEE